MKAAAFQGAIRGLPMMNFVVLGLIVSISAGLKLPPSFAPPSHCAAQPCHYETAEFLQLFAVGLVIGSFCLTAVVSIHVAMAANGGGLRNLAARAKSSLRLLFLLAVALSAAAAGLAVAACGSVLQTKIGILACLSAAVRLSVYACYVLVTAICTYVYGVMAKDAMIFE